MKKLFITFLLAAIAIAGIYGCAKVADSGGGGGSSTVGAITGTVTFLGGTTTANTATVTVTGAPTTAASNQSGWFVLGNIPANTNATLTITANGFVTVRRTVQVVGGETRHSNYTLAPANAAVTGLNATAAQTVNQNNFTGAITSGITIPANSLVAAATGAIYTGTYSVALTPGDSSASDEVEALFPGQFNASSVASGDVYITSFGFANFDVKDSSGNDINLGVVGSGGQKLALAAGATAQWKQEIPASQIASAPDTIDMWYFDETTNTWMQGRDASGNPIVGTKVVEGTKAYYVGNINHFSTWNYDVSYPRAFISGRVVNSSLEAILGAEVKCWGEGWTYRRWRSGETGTNALGQFIEIPVETGKVFQLQATKGSQQSAIYTFGPFAANTVNDVGDIVIAGGSTADIQLILTWGALPTDLDSHMTIPITTGITTRGHVYFSAKGSATSYPYCWLDTDDVTSYGPEVTTVTRRLAGTYRFCIHNWSGQSSHPIESSSAKVEGFIGGQYYVWTVPTSNPDTVNNNVWQVCDIVIDGSGNISAVSTLNTFASTTTGGDPYNPAGVIGLPSAVEIQSINNKTK